MERTERNVVTAIILSIVTCGIYAIYWFIVETDDVKYASGEDFTSGGLAFLLGIITCNIYNVYWAYKMGKMMVIAKEKRGIACSDNSTVYLILTLFGLQVVTLAIIQDELNKLGA